MPTYGNVNTLEVCTEAKYGPCLYGVPPRDHKIHPISYNTYFWYSCI